MKSLLTITFIAGAAALWLGWLPGAAIFVGLYLCIGFIKSVVDERENGISGLVTIFLWPFAGLCDRICGFYDYTDDAEDAEWEEYRKA